ncbi:MAG: ATPase, T2SS/T4P/T4SS family [Saccharofermentanales bacterium]|nr:CpaF family protein [Clostridiaceae bacterium]
MPLMTPSSVLPDDNTLRRQTDVKTSVLDYADLAELVSAVCSRILDSDPALVADIAAGRAKRQALTPLIQKFAKEESRRAGVFIVDLQEQIMDFLFGYGLLQPYIDDESVSDIDGTGPGEFSIKIDGQRRPLAIAFPDEKSYDIFCRLAIIRNGGIINENDSHCRVADERYRLRINVTVPPRSVNCTSISIRKHRLKAYRFPDLERLGMLDGELVSLLTHLAGSRSSVLFCGKGGAGKTTLLRAFIQAMPEMERVLIAESDTELYPDKPYCMVQRIHKPNEGGRPVQLRDLIADGLTMSLDSYVIGEIVGGEAMEFIRAAFSGHRCLATTHAGSATDALERLVTLGRSVPGGESEKLMRRMLAHGIHYLVFLSDFQVKEVDRVVPCRKGENEYEIVPVWRPSQNPKSDLTNDQHDGPLVSGPGRPDVHF